MTKAQHKSALEQARASILVDGCILLCYDCMTTVEFVKFLEAVRQWTVENGLDLVNVNSDDRIRHLDQLVNNERRNKILLEFKKSKLSLWREVVRAKLRNEPFIGSRKVHQN